MADKSNKSNNQRGLKVEREVDLDSVSSRLVKSMEGMKENKNAQQLAKLYKFGKIDGATLQTVHDLLSDPNKMAKDHNQNFVKALVRGKFTGSARESLHFLNAANRSGKEGKKAKEILKELSHDASSKLTGRREKALLKELTSLREEDIIEETTSSTSSAASIATETASLADEMKAAAETRNDNFKIEALDPEVLEKLDRIEIRQARIAVEANQLEDDLKELMGKKVADLSRVSSLKSQIAALHREFEELAKEAYEYQQLERNHTERVREARTYLEKFFRATGIDARFSRRVRMWLSAINNPGAQKPVIKLKSDPKTGATTAKEDTIEIIGISFHPETKETHAEHPGEPTLHYKDSHGNKHNASLTVFKNMLNAYEAYPEIGSLEELNQQIAEQAHYMPLSVGDEFLHQSKAGEVQSFKVTSIDADKGLISTDKTLTTLKRERLSLSVAPELYFDRKKQHFKFGEFARFVIQNDFQRSLDLDEVEESHKNLVEREKADIEAQKIGYSGKVRERLDRHLQPVADKFNAPQPNETRDIVWLDDNFKQRFGRLTQDPSNNTFTLQEAGITADESVGDLMEDMAQVLPMRFAAAPRAKTPVSSEAKSISPNELIKMIADGRIADLPTVNTAENKPKWSIDPHAKFATAAMARSDKGASSNAGDAGDTAALEGDTAPVSMPTANDGEQKETKLNEKKPLGYEEALPFEKINKYGGMSTKEESMLRELWVSTRFLSVDDLWQMGKSMWEYYRRRFERKQKARYSDIGQELPFFAPEMRRINQAAENEEVSQFKDTFDQKGVYEIQERLQKSRNLDELKAAFTVLSEKGQLRWDDIEMWKNLNRFLDPGLAIPIPSNGDPYTKMSKTDDRTGFSFLQGALDSIWGEGTYNDWYQRNKSSYASNAKGFYEEGNELESVQGGHVRRLSELLSLHKNGEYVDPHEFEGLILHSIDNGKSSMQAKLYYMIEGVAAENSKGNTIMSFDRLAHINSQMLGKFPMLEYITAGVPRPDGKGSHRFTKDDYKRWIKEFFDADDPMNTKPGKGVDRFMWKYVLTSEQVKNRINKAFRNAEHIDHDDMYAYMPPASEGLITDATRAATGTKKFFTVEGYANGFPGFSEYFRVLSENGNKTRLLQAMKSYVRYESILTGRYEKERWTDYQRLDGDTLRRKTIVSDEPPNFFIGQLNDAIQQVVDAYDDDNLKEIYRLCRTETHDIQTNQDQMKLQKRVNEALKKFGEELDKVVRRDSGQKMLAVLASANLKGMPDFLSDAEKEARKAEFTDEYNQL